MRAQLEGENFNLEQTGESVDSLYIPLEEAIEFNQTEWVFQFGDEEPVVFAWENSQDQDSDKTGLTLHLKGNSKSSLEFRDRNGKTFKIFAREMTEPTLKMLENSGNIEI